MLLHDCLECQKNKPKQKDLNEAPLQQWGQLETIPMKTIHIDHKVHSDHPVTAKTFA